MDLFSLKFKIKCPIALAARRWGKTPFERRVLHEIAYGGLDAFPDIRDKPYDSPRSFYTSIFEEIYRRGEFREYFESMSTDNCDSRDASHPPSRTTKRSLSKMVDKNLVCMYAKDVLGMTSAEDIKRLCFKVSSAIKFKSMVVSDFEFDDKGRIVSIKPVEDYYINFGDDSSDSSDSEESEESEDEDWGEDGVVENIDVRVSSKYDVVSGWRRFLSRIEFPET